MRKKKYEKYDIPKSVVCIVGALCRDYDRRRVALETGTLGEEATEMCELMNAIVDAALSDIEAGIRPAMLHDIGQTRGYQFSAARECISENAYYRRKHKAIHDIAAALKLI